MYYRLALISVALFATVIFCLGLFFGPWGSYTVVAPEYISEKKETDTNEVLEKEEDSIRIQFLGDIMLARDVENHMLRYGSEYPFEHMREYLDAPYVVGNFEAAIPKIHEKTPNGAMRFSVSKDSLSAFENTGLTHVSLANNHSNDFGREGYQNTIHTLNEYEIETFGRAYELNNNSIDYINTNEGRIALIGVYAVSTVLNNADIAAIMQEAREESDLQIVYVHWGNEYETVHSNMQESLAHTFIDSGADLIVGHHPHVVQDIQAYDGTPIIYSLGNFIFDQYFSDDVQEGLLLEISVSNNEIDTMDLIPISTAFSRTAPRPLTGYERDRFLEDLSDRSARVFSKGIQEGVIDLTSHH